MLRDQLKKSFFGFFEKLGKVCGGVNEARNKSPRLAPSRENQDNTGLGKLIVN